MQQWLVERNEDFILKSLITNLSLIIKRIYIIVKKSTLMYKILIIWFIITTIVV